MADALSHQKDDVADMVGLYALAGRMSLVSSLAVRGGRGHRRQSGQRGSVASGGEAKK
jgi:hypothetical protein